MRFDWDQLKATANLRKHGVSFDEAKTVFYDEHAVCLIDRQHSESEARFALVGMSASARCLFVCYCCRGENTVRLISARKATSREMLLYL